jgi:hypothetical protein
MDLCRQMNEEARHFTMLRNRLEELGGVWDDEYSPDLPEWNQLFSLFMLLDNRFFLDPAKEVVARWTVLNFGIEGWDHLYVQPLFLGIIKKPTRPSPRSTRRRSCPTRRSTSRSGSGCCATTATAPTSSASPSSISTSS